MSDPSFDSTKDLYAYYGVAMREAQSLECTLVHAIYVFVIFPSSDEEIAEIVKSNDSSRWEGFIDRENEKLIKKTMGHLISKLKKANPSDSIEVVLQTALTYRNYLAHEFFVEYAPKLFSQEGVEEALLYIRKLGAYLKNTNKDFIPILRKAQAAYGYDENYLIELAKQRIENANRD